MIEVSLSSLFMIYLIIPFSAIFILWLISEYKSRTKSTSIEIQLTMKCELCLQSFVYDKTQKIVQCPICQTFNDVPQSKK